MERPVPSAKRWRDRRADLLNIPDTEECVAHRGYINPHNGYGYIGREPAHRASYEKHVGPIPAGHESDHVCRNRPCVNYRHLEPVTHSENSRRSVLVGRAPKIKARKLSDPQVRLIRTSTKSVRHLARELGVSREAVRLIKRRRQYKEVADA